MVPKGKTSIKVLNLNIVNHIIMLLFIHKFHLRLTHLYDPLVHSIVCIQELNRYIVFRRTRAENTREENMVRTIRYIRSSLGAKYVIISASHSFYYSRNNNIEVFLCLKLVSI